MLLYTLCKVVFYLKRGGILKLARKIIILIGIILIISYIAHVPSRARNHSCKSYTVSSIQQVNGRSTARRKVPNHIRTQVVLVLILWLIPHTTHFVFDVAKIFFAITHIPVYHWQLARCDLSADAVLSY